MNKIIIFLVFLTINALGMSLKIEANYKSNSFNKDNIKLNWMLKKNGKFIDFYLGNNLKSKIVLKNNKIFKIIVFKQFKGKTKEFEIVNSKKITRELKSKFVPYLLALDYFNIKHDNVDIYINKNQNNFKIIKVVE